MEQLLDYKQRPQLERILEMLKKMDDAARDAGLYGRLHDGERGLGKERKEESAETVSAEGAA